MNESPLAHRLAAYADALAYDDLDDRTVARVTDRVVDALACAYAGLGAPPVKNAIAYASRTGGDRSATVVGGETAGVEAAAFATGAAVRYVDWNDTYLSLEPGHPSDNLGAVLAVADAYGCSGRETVLATALAYELQCRLCDAASLRARGFDHVNYGLVSATLAAAKLMGLSRETMAEAVAIAVNANVALRQARAGELTEWKGLAFGRVDQSAVTAAELAAEGIRGPTEVFEGRFGFHQQVAGAFDLDVASFGGRDGAFKIHETLVKPYPVEYHAQAAVDCALALREAHDIDPRAIERVENESYEAGVSIIADEPEKWRPSTRETADHSMPYCIARALLDGEMTLAQFAESKYTDPDVRALMDRIEVTENPTYTDRYGDSFPHRMVVHTADDTYRHEVEYPRGHPENPLDDAELAAKFETATAPQLDGEERTALLETARRLPALESVSELTARF
jgi:2-methylcitrate dehydratase